jgi:hypothetical protein
MVVEETVVAGSKPLFRHLEERQIPVRSDVCAHSLLHIRRCANFITTEVTLPQFHGVTNQCRSRGGTVGIATGYRLEDCGVRVLVLVA